VNVDQIYTVYFQEVKKTKKPVLTAIGFSVDESLIENEKFQTLIKAEGMNVAKIPAMKYIQCK